MENVTGNRKERFGMKKKNKSGELQSEHSGLSRNLIDLKVECHVEYEI